MQLYPAFLQLSHKKVLVIGGGNVAYTKMVSLFKVNANLTVVSKEYQEKTLDFIQKNSIPYKTKEIEFTDMDGFDLIFSATNHSALNKKLVEYARSKAIWINSVDDPDNTDFYSAATIERYPITIAVSTNGNFPGLSALMRKKLEELIPDGDAEYLEKIIEYRMKARNEITDLDKRREILNNILKGLDEYFSFIKADK